MLFGWLEEDGEVRGAVSRTPPYDLLLSVVPDAGRARRRRCATTAHRGAGRQRRGRDRRALRRRLDGRHRRCRRARGSSCAASRSASSAAGPAPAARPCAAAATDDLELAMRWFDAFTEELDLPERMGGAADAGAIEDGSCGCGSDGGHAGRARAAHRRGGGRGTDHLRLHAARAARTPLRRRVTAAAAPTRWRARPSAWCSSPTLENPAPNKVYQRIGFRPVGRPPRRALLVGSRAGAADASSAVASTTAPAGARMSNSRGRCPSATTTACVRPA